MHRTLLLSSLLATLMLATLACMAEPLYPDMEVGSQARNEITIDMPESYISGILIVSRTSQYELAGCIINEFGVSILEFTYDERTGKTKLRNVMKQLNKWYIKRMLRNDIGNVLHAMRLGETNYVNTRQQITYTIQPINETKREPIYD